MEIRPASLSDAEAMLDIYNREVLESTATFDLIPRELDEQRSYISERSGGLVALVAVDDGVVAGFASLSFYRTRPAYRTSVENSIYVHRDAQRKGVGDALLTKLIEQASAHGFHAMFARIADAQPASMALHTKHGFELVGIEREVGRKFGKWRDCALMQRLL